MWTTGSIEMIEHFALLNFDFWLHFLHLLGAFNQGFQWICWVNKMDMFDYCPQFFSFSIIPCRKVDETTAFPAWHNQDFNVSMVLNVVQKIKQSFIFLREVVAGEKEIVTFELRKINVTLSFWWHLHCFCHHLGMEWT